MMRKSYSRFIVLLALVTTSAACLPTGMVRPIEPATATQTTATTSTQTPSPVPTATATRSAYSDFFARASAASLRVMSYNVNWDSIFPDDDPMNHDLRLYNRVETFARILRAVQPDVLCIQEINYLRSSAELQAMFSEILGADGVWDVELVRDNLIVSRYPILVENYELAVPPLPANLQQAAALVDLPGELYGASDLYLVCSHFKASGGTDNILQRQAQADAIMAHMRDAITPGDNLDLPTNTPYILVGDYNIYDTDPHNHLWTLLRGDIYGNARYGPDFDPDWDGTPLADARPSHIGLGRDYYTWRNDTSAFNPGAFDRIIFTDSVLFAENAFILNTTLLDDSVLAAYGLEQEDVLLDGEPGFFDHLPVVVDFILLPPP